MINGNIIPQITALIEEVLKETKEENGSKKALHDIEVCIQNLTMKIQTLLLEFMVNMRKAGYQGSTLRCDCGGKLKYVDKRPIRIVTLVGEVEIERAYYYCKRCGRSFVPLDKELKLEAHRFSDGVIELISYVCAHLPFEESCEMLEKLTGINMSSKEAQIISEEIGEEMNEELEEQAEEAVSQGLEAEERPKRLYVTMDGTMVHEDGDWHEVKVGAIYTTATQENGQGQQEEVVDKVRYVGQFESSERFGPHISAGAQIRGQEYAEEVIALGDGAPWIWNLVNTYFPGAIEIIDWYHASEHIWGFGKALYGEDEAATKEWVDGRLTLLRGGSVEELIDDLNELEGLSNEIRAERDKLVRYLRENKDRMRYDEYETKGYHIGSGVVESACKHVVQVRLKRPGMRWSRDGAQRILNLRVYHLNGLSDSFWERRRKKVA